MPSGSLLSFLRVILVLKSIHEPAGGLPVGAEEHRDAEADDLARLDEIAPVGVAAGARYPEYTMSAVNR